MNKMKQMKLIWMHLKANVIELMRIPMFTVPTLASPALLFLFFGVTNAHTVASANYFMASYAVFAMLGIALFQFGVNIANDRTSPWEDYLHILPVAPSIRFSSRVLSSLAFAVPAVGLVIVLALLLTPVHLALFAWFAFVAALLLGSIPMTLFGIAIGYWASPKAAFPVANICYLLLAFAGGLWVPPDFLPSIVRTFSPYLPIRQYADLTWSIVLGQPWQITSCLGLLAYILIFGGLAVWGYRRDEGQRYQ
jgi:ABC-2 type transport system permease protein